jgi:NAD(P)-dependent dehydrogenase (short-subunit alcohol dehydrogenase family)
MRLHGKVIAITGAAGGIGAACVARYVQDGASVVCVDVVDPRDALPELTNADSVAAVQADISTLEGNELVVRTAVERFGGLDVFHANAARQVLARTEDTSHADWDVMEATNLRGVFYGAKAAIPQLRRRGGGTLIFTASVLGLVGDADLPAYGAMKGGVRALARSLAAAHGPENIRVNTICPGDVETPMVEQYFSHQPDPEAARREITDRYPLRRFAQPADVAAAAAFLASDDAAYITGTDLIVDGGLLGQIY